jgi:capsule polysaccharide export protein KpsE/RkpR
LQKLTFRYNQAVDKVEEAKLKLEKIKEFHFLRTFSEKEEQINTQMDIIKAWENEVIRLKAQLNQR